MASLKNIVREFRDEIRDGIAWVVVYKEGRSWNAKAVWPDDGDYDEGYTLDVGDLEELVYISKIDNKAICFNGYYCGFGEDVTLTDMENKILGFYQDRRLQLEGDFLECMVCNRDEAHATWYAVMADDEDDDWGTGSYNLDEAKKMVKKYPNGYIAVISESTHDAVCVDEIR